MSTDISSDAKTTTVVESAHPTSAEVDPGHGHSTAAWTMVAIMVLGFLVGLVSYIFLTPIGVVSGGVVVVIGLIVGLIMSKSGFGVAGKKSASKGR